MSSEAIISKDKSPIEVKLSGILLGLFNCLDFSVHLSDLPNIYHHTHLHGCPPTPMQPTTQPPWFHPKDPPTNTIHSPSLPTQTSYSPPITNYKLHSSTKHFQPIPSHSQTQDNRVPFMKGPSRRRKKGCIMARILINNIFPDRSD